MTSTSRKIIIGSRGSELALWQAHFVERSLIDLGYTVEILVIKTQGDKIQHLSLEKLEGKGFFTKEIEEALLSGAVDIAVHSHKDLPTAKTPGLVIAAVSEREDPAELLLIRKECADHTQPFQLRKNAIVGTSSSRRTVQMGMLRDDLQFKDIRGNVPTRIQKLRNGDYDAILLAYAGVHRLQLDISDLQVVKLRPSTFVPAPAQGVLAYQCRDTDQDMIDILKNLHAPSTADAIYVERKVMQLFNGGCHMPLGVYCEKVNDAYHAWAAQAHDRSGIVKRMFMTGDDPVVLADRLFERLKTHDTRSVLITAEPQQGEFASAVLRNNGFQVTMCSFLQLTPLPFAFQDDRYDWLFFTSKKGVQFFFDQIKTLPKRIKIAVIGPETAQSVVQRGFEVAFTGSGDTQETAKAFEQIAAGTRVVFAGAMHARKEVRNAVRAFAEVDEIAVYENVIQGSTMPPADILGFTSPMQADGYLASNTITAEQQIIAIGATTALHLHERGFTRVHVAPEPSISSMAEYISGMM